MTAGRRRRRILVVDVGGNNVKFALSGGDERRKVKSGRTLTPGAMVEAVRQAALDWEYDAVSLGVPGPVIGDRVTGDPVNLGPGWVGFDFAAAFGKPARVVNDAALQALGSYEGGRMLFLGLGTGLGTTLVVDGLIVALELAHLPYGRGGGRTIEDHVGQRGLERLGKKRWRKVVREVVGHLRAATVADHVVLGGGNAKLLDELPEGCRLGDNRLAFAGGVRLWDDIRPERAGEGPAAVAPPPSPPPDGADAGAAA